MTTFKYAKQRKGIGLYAEVEIETIQTSKEKSFVSDHCTWKMINPDYPIVTKGFIDWKDAVLEGMKYALTKIEHKTTIEIKLLDLNGHPCHSNNYSMFGAGFLSVFKDFKIELEAIDKEKIYDFIHASNLSLDSESIKLNKKELEIPIYHKL